MTTFRLTYWEPIHNEFMTHRQLSRNTSSSRAVPVEKVIQQVVDDPAGPVEWGTNKRGMQAGPEVASVNEAKALWLDARLDAVRAARALAATGLHKQLVNRLLFPWKWCTTIASATEWGNFFALRLDAAAQPEIRHLATLMAAKYFNSGLLVAVPVGHWHIPLVTHEERDHHPTLDCVKVSVARCAAVSYHRELDDRPWCEWMDLHDRHTAQRPMHASPFEHQAQALAKLERSGNFTGWGQYRKGFPEEASTFTGDDWRKFNGGAG